MGWREWLLPRRRAAVPDAFDDRWYPVGAQAVSSQAGVTLTSDTALNISGVWACVRSLSDPLAQVPLILYRRMADGGKERATDQPLYEVLHDGPNGWQTSYSWRKLLQGRAVLKGNGYARVVPGKRGAVDQLLPLDPGYTRAVQLDSGRLVYEVTDPKTQRKDRYSQDEVLHIRGMYGDGVSGVPVLLYARNSWGLTQATESYGSLLFSNAVKPGAVLKHPGVLGDAGRQNLKESMQEQHATLGSAHKLLVLEEGMDLSKWGFDNEEAQFLETRQFQLDEICRWFNVPPHKVQNLLRSTNNNIEHQSLEFIRDTMGPWFVNWEQEINRTLVRPTLGDEYFCEFLVDGLMRGDMAGRAAYYQAMVGMGAMTRNEVRERENLNKLPGLDEPVLNMGLGQGGGDKQPKPNGEEPVALRAVP